MEAGVRTARSLRALDYVNLFLADVRDGVGPYLAIYLLATHHWDPANIGVAMSAMSIATVAAQIPCGAWIDMIQNKRLVVVAAALLVGVSCTAMTIVPTFHMILLAQTLNGVAAAIFPAAVAAITLGMVGPARFAVRVGRNEAFNHAGNVGAAILAGSIGYFMGREWIFYLVAAMAAASMVSVLFIEAEDIDYRLARAAASDRSEAQPAVAPIVALLRRQPIVMFAASVTLFHFANAAMLPLAGQMLSQGNAANAALYMSACVIAAQLVMIPVSAVAGTWAEKWGRKPIFLVGFAVLPVRGWLYTVSDDPLFIVAVQLLDGIGAGIFGVLWVTVVADLTKGTGRYNFALGAIAVAQGVGASLSNVTAGYVVGAWGYDAAFLMLSAVALAALTVYYWAMTEPHTPISVETMKVHVPVRCPANES